MTSTPMGRVVVLAERDDDPGSSIIGQELTAAGAEVAITASAESAAEAIQHEHVATLVVSRADLSLVAALRGSVSRRQRGVSIVALVDDPGRADAALTAGADSVLIRPVESERLVEAVSRLA